ncbi:MAG: GNAT family N-acetyltransferase [Thermoplasmata archaeon]
MRPERFAEDLRLRGRYVELDPLAPHHAAELLRAAREPEVQRLLRHRPGTTEAEARTYIEGHLRTVRAGSSVMFSIRWIPTGGVVGATGYHRIDRTNDCVEIGGTWLDSEFWRTPVNTDAKLLLLRHAFDEADVHRVYLQTDLRNERSQRAIGNLGAQREAELREAVVLEGGTYRTSVVFGILREEWPSVKARLEARLKRPWSLPPGKAPAPPPGSPAALPTAGAPPVAPPPSFRSPTHLLGRFVELLPLERRWIPELSVAGRDPEIWRWLRIGPGRDEPEMTLLVTSLLELQSKGIVLAFAVRSRPAGRVVGMTRFLDIDRENRWVEIGTWLDSAVWRTPINTEAKLLMMQHAFETERFHRVQWRTDERNERSQDAIARLGARREGVLREHIHLANGVYRSSVYYSVLDVEWPTVRAGLELKLERPWSGGTPAPPPSSG